MENEEEVSQYGEKMHKVELKQYTFHNCQTTVGNGQDVVVIAEDLEEASHKASQMSIEIDPEDYDVEEMVKKQQL